MADILLSNSLENLAKSHISANAKIDYKKLLGSSLKDFLDALFTNNISSGPWQPFTGAVAACPLYLLSCGSRLSSCENNFSGSGSQVGDKFCGTDDNPWRLENVLLGQLTISNADVVNSVLTLSSILNEVSISGYTSDISKDIQLQHAVLRSEYISDGGSTATEILSNWYGVGVAPDNSGAKLSNDNTFKVCGTNWTFGEGGSCTWTVPNGATRAKFQVWGAGGGSNPGCWGGVRRGGPTGAYAEATMTVSPGDTYTICSGCSCNQYLCSNSQPGPGCMSGVTGPGICCLSAHGGHCTSGSPRQSMYYLRQTGQVVGGPGGGCCRFESFYCTSSGPCWCSNGEYCYDNSCATCGVVAMYPDCCNFTNGCSCINLDAAYCITGLSGINRTVRGLLGGGCLDTNNYGYHIRPPVIDADTGLCFCGGCRCASFSSGTCCGGCNGRDWLFHPGHGGAHTHIMGGTNEHKSDAGKAGMVQVSWV